MSRPNQVESSEHSLSDMFFATDETRRQLMMVERSVIVLERVVINKNKAGLYLAAVNQWRGMRPRVCVTNS